MVEQQLRGAGHAVAVERVGVLVAGDDEPGPGRQTAPRAGVVVDVRRGLPGCDVVGPEADLVVVAPPVAVLGAIEDRRCGMTHEEVHDAPVDVEW
jgi:hypothetical protein